MIPMLVFANALIIDGSEPYSRTLPIEVDWRSFAVDDGGGRLSATRP